MITSLIRVMRQRQYWVGAFVQWLLDADSQSTTAEAVSTETAKKMLDSIAGLHSWASWLKSARTNGNRPILEYYVHRFLPDDTDRLQKARLEEDSDEQFYQLERMWRVDHPAPTPKAMIPPGRLNRAEEDED